MKMVYPSSEKQSVTMAPVWPVITLVLSPSQYTSHREMFFSNPALSHKFPSRWNLLA